MDIPFLISIKNKYKALIIISAVLCACTPDLNYQINGYKQKIIVEAHIATNEYPRVYLSLNNPISQKLDSATILKNIIRYAKVTVSDGTKSEILTSSWEKDHFPPYVYKGTDIVGEEGKKYFLTVEYGGYTLKSETSIPFGTEIDRFESKLIDDNDSLRSLYMTFNINPTTKSAFKVFSKKSKDLKFRETNMLFNSELTLNGIHTYSISPTSQKGDPSYNEGSKFLIGDTVQVQFCAMDSIAALFFKDLTMFSLGTGFGSGTFIGEKKSLNSNISKPGFGVWYGVAIRNYEIVIK